MPKNAFIFDMDGVLIDSEPIHIKLEQQVCWDRNIPVLAEEWRNFVGQKIEAIFGYIVKKYTDGSIDPADLVKEKSQRYLDTAASQLKLFEGAMDFLKLARKNFPKIALTTSSTKAFKEKLFPLFNLDQFFDAVITADDIKQGKPHPEPYLKTCSKLKILPTEAYVLEDSDNGIKSASAAGCEAIGITHTLPKSRLAAAGAKFIVNDFVELKQKLNLADK